MKPKSLFEHLKFHSGESLEHRCITLILASSTLASRDLPWTALYRPIRDVSTKAYSLIRESVRKLIN